MKLFIDVGAHTGEAASAVIAPKYGFDRVDCFEPASSSRKRFAVVHDGRVRLHPFGLWNRTCEKTVFDPGSPGATIFEDKFNVDTARHEECRFVRASEWFSANVSRTDTVFLKLNCEGCECDVIDDLLDSGEYAKVDFMLATLDVFKIPSQKHRAAETRLRLERSGYRNYLFTDIVSLAVHVPIQTWLQFWLQAVGADRCAPTTRLRQWGYDLRRVTRRSGARFAALLAGGR
jgi:FkbM family methyltransferase